MKKSCEYLLTWISDTSTHLKLHLEQGDVPVEAGDTLLDIYDNLSSLFDVMGIPRPDSLDRDQLQDHIEVIYQNVMNSGKSVSTPIQSELGPEPLEPVLEPCEDQPVIPEAVPEEENVDNQVEEITFPTSKLISVDTSVDQYMPWVCQGRGEDPCVFEDAKHSHLFEYYAKQPQYKSPSKKCPSMCVGCGLYQDRLFDNSDHLKVRIASECPCDVPECKRNAKFRVDVWNSERERIEPNSLNICVSHVCCKYKEEKCPGSAVDSQKKCPMKCNGLFFAEKDSQGQVKIYCSHHVVPRVFEKLSASCPQCNQVKNADNIEKNGSTEALICKSCSRDDPMEIEHEEVVVNDPVVEESMSNLDQDEKNALNRMTRKRKRAQKEPRISKRAKQFKNLISGVTIDVRSTFPKVFESVKSAQSMDTVLMAKYLSALLQPGTIHIEDDEKLDTVNMYRKHIAGLLVGVKNGEDSCIRAALDNRLVCHAAETGYLSRALQLIAGK